MKNFVAKLTIILIFSFILIGCGTDVKPSYFVNMFRDAGDIDRLSECLTEVPSVEDDMITIKADSPCLVQLSTRDTSDPNIDVNFSDVLDDPETYLDKIVTFEAIVRGFHYDDPLLYTNRRDMTFKLHANGADIFTLDDEGEEIALIPNKKYKFKCRLYQIKIDHDAIWDLSAAFIISEDREVVHQPIFVE